MKYVEALGWSPSHKGAIKGEHRKIAKLLEVTEFVAARNDRVTT